MNNTVSYMSITNMFYNPSNSYKIQYSNLKKHYKNMIVCWEKKEIEMLVKHASKFIFNYHILKELNRYLTKEEKSTLISFEKIEILKSFFNVINIEENILNLLHEKTAENELLKFINSEDSLEKNKEFYSKFSLEEELNFGFVYNEEFKKYYLVSEIGQVFSFVMNGEFENKWVEKGEILNPIDYKELEVSEFLEYFKG